jgi:hypothetical protein
MSAPRLASDRTWRPGHGARVLHAWRDADGARVAALARAVASDWARAWGVAAPDAVSCKAWPSCGGPEDWLPLGRNAACSAWYTAAPEAIGCLCTELFGVDHAQCGPIAREVAQDCASDLRARMGHGFGLAHASALAVPGGCAWDGFLQVQVGQRIAVLLNAAAVAQLLAGPGDAARVTGSVLAPITPLRSALAAAEVGVRVTLDGCDLDVASLQDLRVGDVVRLQHRLDEPARVEDGAGQPLLAGFLARAGVRKAVELRAGGPH